MRIIPKRRRRNESFLERLDYVSKEVVLSLIGLAFIALVVIFIRLQL